ncbi:hypothetical protein (Partial), partial [Seminavis robusta]|eukprot:Sro2272_g321440.1 n/a (270) ;mRNA; r:2-893
MAVVGYALGGGKKKKKRRKKMPTKVESRQGLSSEKPKRNMPPGGPTHESGGAERMGKGYLVGPRTKDLSVWGGQCGQEHASAGSQTEGNKKSKLKGIKKEQARRASSIVPAGRVSVAAWARRGRRRRSASNKGRGLLFVLAGHLKFGARREEDDLPKVSSKKSSKLSHRAVELTDEDRAKLEHLPNWVNQFQDFLVQVDHISETNCRRAMRQVEKMATGVGITYRHWEKGIWFYRGTQIDPSFDFDKLYDEAVELEREHGKDLGNGWLMR